MYSSNKLYAANDAASEKPNKKPMMLHNVISRPSSPLYASRLTPRECLRPASAASGRPGHCQPAARPHCGAGASSRRTWSARKSVADADTACFGRSTRPTSSRFGWNSDCDSRGVTRREQCTGRSSEGCHCSFARSSSVRSRGLQLTRWRQNDRTRRRRQRQRARRRRLRQRGQSVFRSRQPRLVPRA